MGLVRVRGLGLGVKHARPSRAYGGHKTIARGLFRTV